MNGENYLGPHKIDSSFRRPAKNKKKRGGKLLVVNCEKGCEKTFPKGFLKEFGT